MLPKASLKTRLAAAIAIRWFSVCVGLAFVFLFMNAYEEERVTGPLPLEPHPETGAVFSWTNHTDHRVHYLSADQHSHMAYLTAATIIYWLTVCVASWVRIGMPPPYTWAKFVYPSKPLKDAQAGWIIGIGGVVSLILAVSSL